MTPSEEPKSGQVDKPSQLKPEDDPNFVAGIEKVFGAQFYEDEELFNRKGDVSEDLPESGGQVEKGGAIDQKPELWEEPQKLNIRRGDIKKIGIRI
jgi:hypothetical protein